MKKFGLALILFLSFFKGVEVMAGTNLDRAKQIFDKLDKDHMALLDDFYDPAASFQDPVHRLQGVEQIRHYYENLYKNVESIRFEYPQGFESGDTVTLVWKMHLVSPSIDSGKEITVDGVSVITFGGAQGKAIAHRDYFDMGEFIYERVPVLKSIIGFIKARLAG